MDEKPLPMAPGCALDETGLRLQLQRYRSVGEGASVIEQTGLRLSITLDSRVDRALVDDLLATERECCPFLTLKWEPAELRLTFVAPGAEQEPALNGISLALGLDTPGRP
jgi:hypothetical protein